MCPRHSRQRHQDGNVGQGGEQRFHRRVPPADGREVRLRVFTLRRASGQGDRAERRLRGGLQEDRILLSLRTNHLDGHGLCVLVRRPQLQD